MTDGDGLYAPQEIPVRGTRGSENYVGHEFSLVGDVTLGPYTRLSLMAAYFDTGAFLDENLPAENIGFAQAKLYFVF